jgi:hypothetical protein
MIARSISSDTIDAISVADFLDVSAPAIKHRPGWKGM